MNQATPQKYRGRFAPSPTGALHFGSLVAAVASYLDAKSHAGEWLLRIEDLDTPRNVAGAADQILRQLGACALEWDGEIVHQSARQDLYRDALETLKRNGAVYPCACTRKEIADSSLLGVEGPVYPGTCKNGLARGRKAHAWRVRVDATPIEFEDAIQGPSAQNLATDSGDFVVLRADHVFAYQLAVVVDDAAQGITHIVRGADLLHSTPRQMHLQRLLGFAQPRYAHLPVAVNERGEKLSKQTLAPAITSRQVADAVRAALQFLGHSVPAELARADARRLIAWAQSVWRIESVPRTRERRLGRSRSGLE